MGRVSLRTLRLLLSVSAHPYQLALQARDTARQINERSARRNTVLCRATPRSGLRDSLHDRNALTPDLQSIEIERHGHQVTSLRVNQMAGLRSRWMIPRSCAYSSAS